MQTTSTKSALPHSRERLYDAATVALDQGQKVPFAVALPLALAEIAERGATTMDFDCVDIPDSTRHATRRKWMVLCGIVEREAAQRADELAYVEEDFDLFMLLNDSGSERFIHWWRRQEWADAELWGNRGTTWGLQILLRAAGLHQNELWSQIVVLK
jgi:hypothetical protein